MCTVDDSMDTDMTTVIYRRVQMNSDSPACSEDEGLYSRLVFVGKDGKADNRDDQIKHHGQPRVAALFLWLLCAALLAAVVGLVITMTENRRQLEECRSSHVNLSVSVQERELLERELHSHVENIVREKTELEDRYHQLQNEKSQQSTCSVTAEERDELQRQITRLESMMKIKKHAVDVVLDPDTAHPNLVVSRDGKNVWLGNKQQNLLNIPKRFNAVPCILAKGGISRGKLYYEIQVRQKMCWDIGVAKESINRKGPINYTTKNGYWIVMRRGNEYYAPEVHAVPVTLSVKPEKVGVFVDYEAGLVAFYDADRWNHIHSYTAASFSGSLYPFLSTCAIPNEVPLVISSVKRE